MICTAVGRAAEESGPVDPYAPLCAPLAELAVGRRDPSPAQRAQSEALVRAAAAAYEQNRYPESLRALRDAYALCPTADILFNIAQACRAAGRPELALAAYERTLKDHPEVTLRVETERRMAAVRTKLALFHDERARTLLASQSYPAAIAQWQAAYRLDPQPIFLFRLAQALQKSDQLAAALAAFERFLHEDPKTELRPETERYLGQLRGRTEALLAQRFAAEQRYGQAIAAWDAAYRYDPAPGYLLARAEAEQHAGLLREALASYQRLLTADSPPPLGGPELVAARMQKVQSQLADASAAAALAHGDYAQAARQWEAALRLWPEPLYQFRLAEALRLGENRTAALASYQRFLLQPSPGPERAVAERHVTELNADAAAATTTAQQAARQKRQRQLVKRWWLWTAVAGGVASIVIPAVIATQVSVDPTYPDLRQIGFTPAALIPRR